MATTIEKYLEVEVLRGDVLRMNVKEHSFHPYCAVIAPFSGDDAARRK